MPKAEKDGGFGWALIIVGAIIVYFGVDKLDDPFDKIIAMIIAAILLLVGGKYI